MLECIAQEMATQTQTQTTLAQKLAGHTFTISSRFTPRRILGTGSYGVVCSAYDAEADQHIAIKRVRPMAADQWDARHTLREIRLMRILAFHPNIISSHGLALNEAKEELYIMLELMDCDLHYLIGTGQTLTETHLKCFLKQMLEGLKAMHSLKILHRDLKPANILVTKDCKLRITDFGLARYMDDDTQQGKNTSHPMTEYVVTRWYRAPELLLGSNFQYSAAIDVWSVGCIFAELIRGNPLFPGKAHAHQVQMILQVLGSVVPSTLEFPIEEAAAKFLSKQRYPPVPFTKLLPGADQAAINFIERTLQINPGRRLTVQQALDHPYLRDAPELYDYSKITLPECVDESLFAFEREEFTLQALQELIRSEVAMANDPTPGSGAKRRSSGTSCAPGDKLPDSCASTACPSSVSEDASVVSADEAATNGRYKRADSSMTDDMHFRRSHDSQSDYTPPNSVPTQPRHLMAEAKSTRQPLQAAANSSRQSSEGRSSKQTVQRARSSSAENFPSTNRHSKLRSNSEHAVPVDNLHKKTERRHTSLFGRFRRHNSEEQAQDEPPVRMRLPRILSRIFSDHNLGRHQQPLR